MVAYIRSDLDFILDQIKIAEEHAAGRPLYGQGGLIPSYNLAWGLRTVDGSYNHLLPGHEQWGAADQQFPELLDPDFRPAEPMVDMDGPGPMQGGAETSYTPSNNANSIVVDSSLRTISNLLVDQSLANPAAVQKALEMAGVAEAEIPAATIAIADAFAAYKASPKAPADLAALHTAVGVYGVEMQADSIVLANVSPDVGLSASFNSWFTLFGQFFDHGLDLVNKGGSGTVFIPLQPDDPLYVPGSPTNFMVLTRATVSPGQDGIMGTADDVRPVNTTTSFVDQNQTYTSHSSHQVFLRQYAIGSDGRPHATGKLIEGANGGMATWGEVKAQAKLLGVELTDFDVGSVPLLRTDAYGNFIPDANGFAQVITGIGADGIPNTADDDVVSGTFDDPVNPTTVGAIRTSSAFLADIAHNAVPIGKIADGDIEVGLGNPQNGSTEYDNELLDRHFIAGDGRVNENIGLTAVHHVFHAEHNRLVQHTKDVVLADAAAMLANGATQAEAVTFLNEWLAVDVVTVPTGAAVDSLVWDGERVFQAAKFGTEMQYQHLVFEEFARKIQPNINVFLVPDGFDATIDPTIVAEFAHVVYRFGHSMLTETIDRFDASFNDEQIGLIEGFLNPLAFNGADASIADEDAAAAIIRGMTRQVGNEIDEFVTGALRNNLLGLPLDLATINLARGRDTGVPSLNAARRDFYEMTNDATELKPYISWVDFAGNLKNEASIINFIAAYGKHELITSQTTAAAKRDAALTIITGASVGGLAVPEDAEDFLNSTGAWVNGANGVTITGLDDVDLWIGGLAEKILPFGGMLGSTFNFVFEVQMEKLQSGDRFYYLQRLDGLHLFGEMENNSFAAMMMRNTDATHLPSDVFSTPGLILEVDRTKQYNPGLDETAGADGIMLDDPNTTVDESADNLGSDPTGGGILTPLVVRDDPNTPGVDTNYLKYTGDQHIVLGGTSAADVLIASEGDDTLYGDEGNDRLEGGAGNDIINGGAGDDIIRDSGGDDNIKAGDGNDVVHAGPGLDLVMGGRGQDFVVLGTDMGSEVFAGEGNDFILGNKNAERILGNEGDDWIETGTFDGAPGDNFDEVFAHDDVNGHDVFLGDGGFDEFIGEGGDDIMVGSLGRGKMAGMSGFDWATYSNNTFAVNADLSRPIIFDEAPTIPANASLDEYQSMEGLSGTRFDDVLSGSNVVAAERLPVAEGGDGAEGYRGSQLTKEGVARIAGLQQVLGLSNAEFATLAARAVVYSEGDIILGGDGSDVMAGLAGDDIIDGDKWLNVRISVRENLDGTGNEIDTANSMTELVTKMFNGTYNPGQLQIVREILTANGAGDTDIAVFSDLRANYDITYNADGTATVAHARGTLTDGTDTIRNIERLRFSDVEIALNAPPTGAPVINDLTPTEGQALTLNTSSIADVNGLGPFSYQWQSSANGTDWTSITGATGATFTPNNPGGTQFGAQAGQQLRVVVSFTDGGGTVESVTSAPTGPVGVDWDGAAATNNTFNGTAGDDVADGVGPFLFVFGGNDTLNGNGGNDDLDGQGGSDTINGGAGNDLVTGGTGSDTAVFAGAVNNFSFDVAGSNILVTDRVGAEGTDTINGVEQLRFNGVNYEVVLGSNAGATTTTGAGSQAVFGFGGNDAINAGTGDDLVHGGDGNDTITQVSTAGRDRVDGGVGTNDTFQLNGVAGAETFRIYTRAAAVAAGIAVANTDTEIVITRQVGVGAAAVVAELDNIEEIRVNTGSASPPGGPVDTVIGGDTIQVFGNFAETSLALNTITVNGGDGDDTVDISGLTSEHRVVFRSNGGNDTLVGSLRPNDMIELAPGKTIADYNSSTNEDGTTTLTCGDHVITYLTSSEPTFRELTIDTVTEPPVEQPVQEEPEQPVQEEPEQPDEQPADRTVWGSHRSDKLHGGAGNDEVHGRGGHDGLSGYDGADRLYGDRGNDKLSGGGGGDMLFGGSGQDRLNGGAGADKMWGGAGNDLYHVDDGMDRVHEGKGQGTDTVKSSVSYTLSSNVEKLVLAGSADLNGIGNGRDNVLKGNSGDNRLFGKGGEDDLFGGAGDDTLAGGKGSDSLIGGAGSDTFVFEKRGGRDHVRDFKNGNDKIDVRSLGVDDVSDLNISQVGHDVEIRKGHDVLVLKNTLLNKIDNGDFFY